MKFISSADNPRYKLWKKLALDNRWSKSSGLCLVAPGRLRKEFLDLSLDIQQEIVTEEHEPVFPGRGTLLPKTLFDRLDTLGTHEPLYIIKSPPLLDWPVQSITQHKPMLFCPLGDPKNLGALIRSALAFDVADIVLTEEACYPYLPAVIKSSALAVFKVRLYKGPALRDLQGSFFALDSSGTPLGELSWTPPFWILLGQEGQGLKKLSPKAHVKKVSIPINPQVESLNATVAGSIFLYELAQKRPKLTYD